jgi:hypothetical protein
LVWLCVWAGFEQPCACDLRSNVYQRSVFHHRYVLSTLLFFACIIATCMILI